MSTWLPMVTAAVLAAAGARAAPPKTERERLSYALGVDLGRRLRAMPLEVEPALVASGVEDVLAGRTPVLADEDVRAALEAMQAELKARQAARLAAAVGERFLAENRKKDGVVTLPSGLQYRVVKPGDGPVARDGAAVACHWRERLVDGTELDSSYRRGGPTTVKLDGDVIAAWREVLRLMPEGSRWELFVPPHLAYGERGEGRVGPNATLVFELEVLAVR
ncbi:FKBP-type peptidyl-prolyl cis-trans isomerase N-terminal domain-containing protein [Anaeromyxobacter oryzae]|uniref:Peptidyl-prolyl cis-trans isomerase n=1 Tax=Anaeromyxobacter oryzae TaxID=2918170 RepID=A0ABM7WPL5_9BACT|nr:FKBP-type peptidyl-prolyl cis-trans isomerase [Anaeromyxobacter oryzae]BDG01398.1 outer membrane protein MIP [Anaeromyxobacter oryzae]